MSEDVLVSIKIIDELSSTLNSIGKSFIQTANNIEKSITILSGEVQDLKNSIDTLSTSIREDLNNVSFNDLMTEFAAVSTVVGLLNIAVRNLGLNLQSLAGIVITIPIALKLVWDIGSWIFDNVIVPIDAAAIDGQQRIADSLSNVPTEALKGLDEIYRQSGDSVHLHNEENISYLKSNFACLYNAYNISSTWYNAGEPAPLAA